MLCSNDFNQDTSISSLLYSCLLIFALFYEGNVASENKQNLKYSELKLWLPGTGENEEEKALYVSLLYIDNASQFHIISSYNILSLP